MTMIYERHTLSNGQPYTRVVATGEITKADAREYLARSSPSGVDGRVHMVVVAVEPDISVAAEARPVLASKDLASRTPSSAIVLTNAPLRVLASFLVRMSGSTRTRFFASEAPALEWLASVPPVEG
ncbi:MAG: hypothetical protein JNG84_11425 [Archangium sp.]|nr:hypothetical protein [Archangium sp.]